MSVSVLIQAVKAEGLGGGGMVAAAFRHVQVAGVLEGCDVGGADGGQVDGPAAGAAGAGRGWGRPGPVGRVMLPAGTCRQGRALIRACSSGWFCFTTAM